MIIQRNANATRVGKWLTIYRWEKGPTLSIESWSNDYGTVVEVHALGKRSIVLSVPVGSVDRPTTRIRARRWYK